MAETKSVGGRSMIPVTWMLKSRIHASIVEAERLKGSAPNTPEVVVIFHENYTRMIGNGYMNAFI